MPHILIVDDDRFFRTVITKLLTGHGYDITAVESGEEALRTLQARPFDLMISDVNMTPMDGLELLDRAGKAYANMGIIMLTGHDEVDIAMDAMKKGAFDFLVKPFQLHDLFSTVQRSLEYYTASPENNPLKTRLDLLEGLVAESAGMKTVSDTIRRIAPTNVTVLLCGETGTEKELIARTLHYYSSRKDEPFIIADCTMLAVHRMESELFGCVKDASGGTSAAKKGLFEAARGGTIFLNDISAMPLDLQLKLLRVMHDKQIQKVGGTNPIDIDVRIIAASNENLALLVEQGEFYESLYCRLTALHINIPPLRTRPEDVFPLIDQTLRQLLQADARPPALDAEAKEILRYYSWPANVLELQNAFQYALSSMQNGVITKKDLPVKIIAAGEEMVRSGVIAHRREQLKGKSFTSLLHNKQKKKLEQPAVPLNPPIPLPDEEDEENKDYW